MYFNMFPNLIYDPVGNGSGKLVKNILKRIRVRNNMKKEFAMLDPYDVQEGLKLLRSLLIDIMEVHTIIG